MFPLVSFVFRFAIRLLVSRTPRAVLETPFACKTLSFNVYKCCLHFVFTVAMFTSGQYQAAVNIWKNICLVRYDDLLGRHPFTASLLDYMGEAYGKLGYLRKAVDFKEKSLTMRRFLLGNLVCIVLLIYKKFFFWYGGGGRMLKNFFN